MAFVCPNLVHETTTVTGPGPATLLGAASGALDFDSQLANGDTTPYAIVNSDASEYEIGRTVFSTSGPSISRDTVLYGSNGTSSVDFTGGTKNVYISLPGNMVESLLDQTAGNGLLAQTTTDTYARRTLTAGAGLVVTDGDGVAGNPTAATTFLNPETGGVARTGHDWMEDRFSLRDFGVVGDGSDESTAIQVAIDAAEDVPGTEIWVPSGAYNLGTTGITILGDGIVFQGSAPRFVGGDLFGTEFTYSGTGNAVTFGSGAKTVHYRNGFNNIQIRATGGAQSAAGAVGLRLYNQHYFFSSRAAVKDFLIGTGIQLASGDSGFGATSSIHDVQTHQCKTGIAINGDSLSEAQNHVNFWGGAFIGFTAPPPAGSIGVDIGIYADSINFHGTDIESFEVGVEYAGRGCAFISTRGEYCTNEQFHIDSTALGIQLIHHRFIGVASEAGRIVDDTDGQLVFRLDRYRFSKVPSIYPNADGGQVLHVLKADGSTTVFNIGTSGTPQVTFPNDVQLVGYSDAYITQKWIIDGSTGDIKGVSHTASGTAIAVGSGEVSIGGDTAVTVGAAGGAAPLPATPLGFINCYVGATAVKIPYYNN